MLPAASAGEARQAQRGQVTCPWPHRTHRVRTWPLSLVFVWTFPCPAHHQGQLEWWLSYSRLTADPNGSGVPRVLYVLYQKPPSETDPGLQAVFCMALVVTMICQPPNNMAQISFIRRKNCGQFHKPRSLLPALQPTGPHMDNRGAQDWQPIPSLL